MGAARSRDALECMRACIRTFLYIYIYVHIAHIKYIYIYNKPYKHHDWAFNKSSFVVRFQASSLPLTRCFLAEKHFSTYL